MAASVDPRSRTVVSTRIDGWRRRVRTAACAVLLPLLAAAPACAQRAAAQSAGPDDAILAQSLFRDLRWRNIGPANIAGRISALDAVEANPAIIYLGAASGGVWKSVNAGTTWEPIFDRYGSPNIGDVKVFQANPDIVWVATGEGCVRNSVGWGDGIYRSTDGGKTFSNVGLRDTHHIDEIVLHPANPDIAWVAAGGHLWGYNDERGIYRTVDGGRTWQRLTNGLPDDGRTGASDLVIDPTDPDILYAGMWERIRRPYNFESGGPNGGIYRTTDGGATWAKLTNGLPSGPTGRIGLAVYRRDPRILMAMVEHGYQPPVQVNGQPNPDHADMTKLGTGIYRSEDGGATWQYVNRYNNRPFYYSHIRIDPNDAQRVYVLTTTAYVSEDGGRTFDRSFQGIANDFHAMWINPANSDHFYIGNDKGPYVSHDRGHTFTIFDNLDIAQFYAIGVDMRDPYWIYGGLQDNGSWGGPSNSRDYNGILTDHWFKMHSGDGFHAAADPRDWRVVYTETENGNLRRIDALFRQQSVSIRPLPSNIRNYAQYAPGRGASEPRLPRDLFRFNWSTPFFLSPHDASTLYLAGNHVFRSTDRGDTWTIISPDLSTNDPVFTNPESGGLTRDASGAETHATVITLAESPLVPGLLWAGTDDGNVQLTRDGGRTWTNVRPNIRGVPAHRWVSRVTPSRFDAAVAYVSFDGHRSDDFRPYILRTADYGRTWTSVASNLPASDPVYVVREDLKNPRLLFAGTEFGLYASIDGGRSWHRFMTDFPVVPVHDLVIHPRDNDLIAATHGRSIWILDDLGPLQQLTDAVLASDVHLFDNRAATKWRGTSRGATRGHQPFMGRNPLSIDQRPPANNASELANTAPIAFWLKQAPASPVLIEIASADGAQRYSDSVPAAAGINRIYWNLRFGAAGGVGASAAAAVRAGAGSGGGGGPGGGGPGAGGVAAAAEAAAGTYIVRLTVNGRAYDTTIRVRADPALPVTLF
jgi:photosystem II stability/assembly factor-like uncharacterized protein